MGSPRGVFLHPSNASDSGHGESFEENFRVFFGCPRKGLRWSDSREDRQAPRRESAAAPVQCNENIGQVQSLPFGLCLEINSYLAPVDWPELLYRVPEGGPVTYCLWSPAESRRRRTQPCEIIGGRRWRKLKSRRTTVGTCRRSALVRYTFAGMPGMCLPRWSSLRRNRMFFSFTAGSK